MPHVGHSFEGVCSAFREAQPRSRHEIFDGARDKDLAAARGARDPRTEMHCQAFDRGAAYLSYLGEHDLEGGTDPRRATEPHQLTRPTGDGEESE